MKRDPEDKNAEAIRNHVEQGERDGPYFSVNVRTSAQLRRLSYPYRYLALLPEEAHVEYERMPLESRVWDKLRLDLL